MKFIWSLLFSLLLSTLLLRPILGNFWYPMHDTTHVARLYLMEIAIRGGQFPPLWAEGINNGLGYPLFHFYAPLFYYTALIIKQFVGAYILALKITLAIFLGTGILGVMHLSIKWGRAAAIVAAALFALAPYLAVDLYVRGAYSELAALCLFPWVLYVWQDITTGRKQVIAAIMTTFFILSHNLIPILSLPLVAIWVIYCNFHILKRLIVPSVLTILLSSFFLLPLVFERSFVQADAVAKTSDYRLHFVEPWQIWNSAWGFGGSAAGTEDGFSFKMGKIQLVMALLGFVLLLIKKNRYWILGIFAVAALLMSTSYTQYIWQITPLLALAQFPWRYLAIVTSLLAVLGGYAIAILPYKFIRVLASLAVITMLLFINLKYFVPQSTFVAQDTSFTDPQYLSTVSNIIPEYMPVWLNNDIDKSTQYVWATKAYYPTWQVKIDGVKVNSFPSESGLLAYNNPTGSTNIEIVQSHTLLQQISYTLTIIGFLFSIYWYIKK
ncbi:MAG: 6-pyruvoyl-tetrahydropterin synthase-related protein [bacterium]